MLKIFFRKQLKTCVLIVLFFSLFLFFQNSIDSKFTERYYAVQEEYIEESGVKNNQAFFEQLEADEKQADKTVNAIESFENYDKEIVYNNIDPALIASGAYTYANYEMIVWREEMLAMPGVFAKTVADDSYMLSQLSQRFANQKNFDLNLWNNLELMRRGMRRNDGDYGKYSAVYKELQKIDADFAFADTLVMDKILSYIENDFYIIVLLALCFFSVFSNATQNRITNQIVISPKGIRKYVRGQCLISVCFTVITITFYYIGIILLLSGGNFSAISWQLPIQAINGYENISYAFSAGQYFFYLVLAKTLYCILTVSVFLFLSSLSKNNIISALLCGLYCTVVIILYNINLTDRHDISISLLGSSKYLFSDLPFLQLGNLLISYYFSFLVGVVFIAVILLILTVFLSKYTAKRWAK